MDVLECRFQEFAGYRHPEEERRGIAISKDKLWDTDSRGKTRIFVVVNMMVKRKAAHQGMPSTQIAIY